MASRWSRPLTLVGLAAMIVAVVDPLEGSIAVLIGAGLAVAGARLARRRHPPALLYVSLASVALGVAALWSLSALGGFGGSTGRSAWWALVLVPYPAGWILGILGAVQILRERQPAP